jgi:hypothetical protein
MKHRAPRPSRRRRESARTAPRMTLLPEPVAAEAYTSVRDRRLGREEAVLGPYEDRYDVSLGYASDRFVLVP